MKHAYLTLIFLFSLLAQVVLAQNARYVSASGTNPDPASATNWANATADLQGAINSLPAPAGGTVYVARGTYKPGGNSNTTDQAAHFSLASSVTVVGGFDPATNPVTRTPQSSTLSGVLSAGVNSYNIIRNRGVAATAVLDGFVITGGNANGSSGQLEGGAIYNINSSPTLINCLFQGNSARFYGGAINNNIGSSPTLTNCTFLSNLAASGGAIYNNNSSPTLTNCTFMSNSSINGSGGAIVNFNGSVPTLTNCAFGDNFASQDGGAIYSDDGNFTLTGCTFRGNSSQGGGAIFIRSGSPTLTGCTFLSNSVTSGQGGAIYNLAGNSSLTNCTFQGNSANQGGAIFKGTGNPTLTNCLFQRNSATIQGGAIYNDAERLTLTNCTFQGNSAPFGGAIVTSGIATLTNCIVYSNGNTPIGGANVSATYNLFGPTGGAFPSGATNKTTNNSPFIDESTNLRLNNTAGAGALAIDAGDPSTTPATVGNTDLGGQNRFVNTLIDMGAYEYQTPPPTQPGQPCPAGQVQATNTTTPSGPAVQVTGGVKYERIFPPQVVNGVTYQFGEQNTTGLFIVPAGEPYRIVVTGADGCTAPVQGTR